jgi:LysR family transcriptional regulator, cys regulon transcriptional activator
VHLELHQGGPDEIVAMLRSGQADIGVATEALGNEEDLVAFPFYQWHHAIIVPDGHPLAQAGELTLQALAEWPLITYHEGYTGRSRVDAAFAAAGLAPNIVITALDADVIKSYVELGLGVGIIAAMAFHPVRDAGLTLIEAPELFERNTTLIALRRGHYLRDYIYRFLAYCSPELDATRIRKAATRHTEV